MGESVLVVETRARPRHGRERSRSVSLACTITAVNNCRSDGVDTIQRQHQATIDHNRWIRLAWAGRRPYDDIVPAAQQPRDASSDGGHRSTSGLPQGGGDQPPSPARHVTINDVGAAAGVSRQTVTRAMNAMDGISAATRERVLLAAQELGYRPSRFGRGLVKGGHATLGLVIEDLANPYYPELASAVLSSATAAGWNVILADDRHTTDRHQLLSDLALQVDGVVGYLKLTPAEQRFIFRGLPVVEIDPPDPQPPQGAVMLDPAPAMVDAARHLIERGVQRPVMIDRSAPGRPSARARAFINAMAALGLPAVPLHMSGDSIDDGLAGTRRMLTEIPDADGVMTFNDLVALGALRALRDAGRVVPDDVRVIGIDGLRIGAVVTPTLTTLALNMHEVGRAAVDLVVGMAAGTLPGDGQQVQHHAQHQLLVREST